MLKYILILTILIITNSCKKRHNKIKISDKNKITFEYNEDKNIKINNLEKKTLLSALFQNSISRDSEIVWKPNIEEFNYFKNFISKDSLCHTRIYECKIYNLEKYLPEFSIILFKTGDYDSYNYVIGMVMIEKKSNEYIIKNFKKYVFKHENSGIQDSISLETFGEENYPLLKVSGYYYNTRDIIESYYSLTDFHLVYDFLKQSASLDLTNGYRNKIINKRENEFDIITEKWNGNKTKTFKKHFIYNPDLERFE